MKAVWYSRYGGNEVMERVDDAPVPEPGEGQVLVRVHTAALNPVDWKIRAGYLQQWVPLTFPVVPGGDFSGEVVRAGPGADHWRAGDAVFGLASVVGGSSGSLAEFATASAGQIAHKPHSLTDAEAAAAVLAGSSAVQAMDDTIHPAPGRKVLIHGGSGGVGSFAIQYARHLGAHIATTVRGERAAFVRHLGADEVVDYTQQRFEAVLHDYDAVFDLVGGDVLERSFQVLKPGGVLVSLVEQPNAALIDRYGVQAQLQGTLVSTVRLEQLADLIDRGVLKVYIDRVLPLDRAQEAFDYQQNGHPQCKVVVTVG